jgi:GntR family transcriptional repressor for pyruvate dehydrogenase complex
MITEDLQGSFEFSREPLHERIAATLEDIILARHLTPGSQLPPERELASTLGVSRVTVHQAMLLLEQRGVVQIRTGSGIFVTDVPPTVVASSIEHYYTFGGFSHEELIKFREILEPEIAALAAERATAEEIEQLRCLVEEIEGGYRRGDLDRWTGADVRFHEVLAQATRNELIFAVMSGLHRIMHSTIAAQIKTIPPEESVLVHRPIYEAIAGRSPNQARVAMQAHLRTTWTDFRLLTGQPDEPARGSATVVTP